MGRGPGHRDLWGKNGRRCPLRVGRFARSSFRDHGRRGRGHRRAVAPGVAPFQDGALETAASAERLQASFRGRIRGPGPGRRTPSPTRSSTSSPSTRFLPLVSKMTPSVTKDAVGNRTTNQINDSVLTSAFNEKNQLTSQLGRRDAQGPGNAERAGHRQGQRQPRPDAGRERLRGHHPGHRRRALKEKARRCQPGPLARARRANWPRIGPGPSLSAGRGRPLSPLRGR